MRALAPPAAGLSAVCSFSTSCWCVARTADWSLDAEDTDESEGEADCGEDGRDDAEAGGTASVRRLVRGGPAVAGLGALARWLLGAELLSGSHLRGFCHTLAGAVGGLDDSARLHGTMVEGEEVSEY